MSTTIENYCLECRSVASNACEAAGHTVGTLGTEPDKGIPSSAPLDDSVPSGEKRCADCGELYMPSEPYDESVCSVCASKVANEEHPSEKCNDGICSVCTSQQEIA